MRAHVLQHVAFEGPGGIADWLDAHDFSTTVTHFYAGNPVLPDVGEIDLLVIMGGPMSVHDEAEHPWLVAEKQFVDAVVKAGKPVLGICLGAQLIASVLGARVYPNALREIGWLPIRAVENSAAKVFAFPPQLDVFHWHGETFDLPAGAHLLANSAACAHQAFQWGRRVIGLQFHLETTAQSAREIVAHCRAELVSGPYVQSEAQILAAPAQNYADINALMGEMLAYLTAS